ncbi:MAG: YdbH domain-containing protein [Hyphomonadaceae bacterium]
MAHRSNQVVASQDRAAPQQPPEDAPPPARQLLAGWATALAALLVSTGLLALGVWLVRFSVAEFMIGAALAERGVEAEFDVTQLDFGGATLSGVRFGAETSPDAAMPTVEARWRWEGLTPRLRLLRLIEPRLRLRLDQSGRISAGALDNLRRGGPPARRRPAIPRLELEIVDGQALIEAPFGALTAEFESDGVIGSDFSASARVAPTDRVNGDYALQRGAADLVVMSRDDTLAFRLTADASAVRWRAANLEGAALRAMGRAALDLSRLDVELAWRVASLDGEGVSGETLSGAAGLEALLRDEGLALGAWEGEARVSAAALSLGGADTQRVRLESHARGDGGQGSARWTLAADRFAGAGLISRQPSASGELRFDSAAVQTFSGDALLHFAQSELSEDAQRTVRGVFPNLAGLPPGPTFASARAALDRAGDRFDLTVPIGIDSVDGAPRIRIAAPAAARAASGAVLALTPLRDDAPALTLQWPGPTLHGAVALELSGGGAPRATLLLDNADWSPGAPFEADGTLTLANWRAEGASIDAQELGIALAFAPNGGGHVDLRGPARFTGPVGAGQARDVVAQLNIGIHWGGGWRIVSNDCIAMRVGALDVAGLAFSNGALGLCPLNGALIAADARQNLSGGFMIQRLALNGRMANGAQPARLEAADVIGRFRGRTGDMRLALEAAAPSLSIDMAEDRVLRVTLARLTADAYIGDGWRVEGAFERGTLTDPALPGSVSTLTGAWSATPEGEGDDAEAVIRVSAGEALLTANRPATDAERPLFHPLRLRAVDGVLRGGRMDAEGEIVLEERALQIARFTAFHDVDEGLGRAEVRATDLQFGDTLQPYDITERARGMVENVRGPVTVVAEISWTRDQILGVGLARLNGVSLATATIPVVEDVRGDVYFDNIFELTTAPGQQVRVGLLDPGVAVHNGDVRFQLLDEQRVSIERAEFDFAGGVLAMAPTTISLGADETRFELTLRDVEGSDLLRALRVQDLSVSGRFEGDFPLLLTRRSAFIQNGRLWALDGGVIAYTGAAGESTDGPARVAFDALRQFRYDVLALTLDGDLGGEVISSIEFSGRNTGEAVDLGEIAQVPGFGNVTVRGVPFDFNVRITAPFRRLAQTAATISDPTSLLDREEEEDEDGADEPVDPTAPPAR